MVSFMVVVGHGPREIFRVVEGLRLCAAMLGMDQSLTIVFADGGVRCLRPGTFEDPVMKDYLNASSDLAGIHVLEPSLGEQGMSAEDLDPDLDITLIDMEEFAEMMGDCKAVAAF